METEPAMLDARLRPRSARPTIVSAIVTLLAAAAVLPANALAGGHRSRWRLPAGVIACRHERVAKTAPTTITFRLSSQVGLVEYVGKHCLTLLVAEGPATPLGETVASYVNVLLTRRTVYRVGAKRVSFAHLFSSPRTLLRHAGPMASITLVGRLKGNYARMRATRIVFLPRGKRLPG